MKKEAILVLFLLILPFGIADDFTGIKYQGDFFTLNTDNFSLQLSNDWKNLFVKYNKQSLIVEEGRCETTNENFYLICYHNSIVDFHNDIGKIDERTGDTHPGLNLTINYQKPDITVKREFSDTMIKSADSSPMLWEEAEVTVTIKNDGKNPALVTFIDPMPTYGVEITPGSSVGYNGKEIIYTASVGTGAVKTLTYKIKPVDFIEYNLTGNLSYIYEGLNGNIALPIDKLKIEDSVNASFIDYSKVLGVAQRKKMDISLQNLDGRGPISANITLTVPKDIKVKVLESGFKEVELQKYFYETLLPKLETKELDFEIITTKTGNYTIHLNYGYNRYGVNRKVMSNVTIEVVSERIEPTLTIKEKIIGSNQKIKLKAVIENMDTDTEYQNINMDVDSAMLKESFAIPRIIQNQDIVVFEKDVVVPTVDKETDYDIEFSGTYETINNEEFNFTTTKTITVYPPSDTIIIYHEFDKFGNETDIARVIVYVENTRDVRIDKLTVSEFIPDSYEVIDGKTTLSLSLGPKRKAQSYTYTIKAKPGVEEGKEVKTTVTFNETDREFKVIQPLTINISGKSVDEEEATTEVIGGEGFDSDKNEAAEEANVRQSVRIEPKKSLWQKFIDFLLGFI